MNEARMHFAGMSKSPYQNISHKFYITAPFGAEVLTNSGWEKIGSYLRKSIPCLMQIDEFSFLMAIGTGFPLPYSAETYVLNATDNTWNSGPSLTFS